MPNPNVYYPQGTGKLHTLDPLPGSCFGTQISCITKKVCIFIPFVCVVCSWMAVVEQKYNSQDLDKQDLENIYMVKLLVVG